MSLIRPKGVPRTEWNAMSGKQQGKLVRQVQVGMGGQQVAKKDAKWHFAANVPMFGNVSLGSGDKANQLRRGMRADSSKSGVRRELMAEVLSSQAFVATQYRIQPADETIFPWVGSIAAKYQKWRCRYLALEYVPTVDSFADAGKQGRVVLCANYDPLDPGITTIVQAETISPNQPCLPSKGAKLVLDSIQVTPTPLLVRPGQVPAGGTVNSYDGGVMYICTNGASTTVPDGTKLGEVFIHYEFEFFDPIIPGQGVTPAPTHSMFFMSQWDVTTSIPAATWVALPDIIVDPTTQWNGLGAGLNSANGVVSLPPGRYHITGKGTFTAGVAGVSLWQTGIRMNGSGSAASFSLTEFTGSVPSGNPFTMVLDYTFVSETTVTFQPVLYTAPGTAAALSGQWFSVTVETI